MMVVVGGSEIPEAAIAAEMQHHPASSPDEARWQAARALVVRRLLLAEAVSRGLWSGALDAAGPAVETAIERLLAAELSMPNADVAACRRFYQQNKAKFITRDLYEAQHILLAVAPDDDEMRPAVKARAVALIALLAEAPDRFGEFARAESACPSKENDGHLGQFAAGTTVPEFETFLAAIEEGQLCPIPVETRFGFHVVRLLRRLPGRPLPFEAVQARVADMLSTHAWQMAVRQYLMRLAAAAEVSGFDLPTASGPLLQ